MGHLTRIRICFYTAPAGNFYANDHRGTEVFDECFHAILRNGRPWYATSEIPSTDVCHFSTRTFLTVSTVHEGRRKSELYELVGRILNRSPFSANLRPFFENDAWTVNLNPCGNLYKSIYIYIYIFRFAGFRGEVSYVDEKIGKICRIFLVSCI